MAPVAKQALKDELVARLGAALAAARDAHAAAAAGATHAEAKAENDKDTRGLELSYLARGQAQRVEELATELAAVEAMTVRAFGPDEPIAAGAVVVADEDGEARRYFVAPGGGGEPLAAGTIQAVTPRSPLGRALCGLRAGEVAEVRAAGKRRELEIVEVD